MNVSKCFKSICGFPNGTGTARQMKAAIQRTTYGAGMTAIGAGCGFTGIAEKSGLTSIFGWTTFAGGLANIKEGIKSIVKLMPEYTELLTRAKSINKAKMAELEKLVEQRGGKLISK